MTGRGEMRATYASRPAPGATNEDLVVVSGDFAVVLDGATAPSAETGCTHGVAWFVRTLGAALVQRLLAMPSTSLPDILAEAITWAGTQHPSCDLSHPDGPTSTVAILRERRSSAARPGHDGEGRPVRGVSDGSVEYLVLADSPILLDTAAGLRVILDDRLATLPSRTPEAVRWQRNSQGGFWVAGVDPQAAYQAVTGSVPTWQLRRAALLSDGASRLVERFGSQTWAQLMGLLSTEGPNTLIERVRAAETADAARPVPHRGKPYDDATAVVCSFD